MSPKLAPPEAHSWGDPMEVHEVEKCTAGGIPVLIGQLYFIFHAKRPCQLYDTVLVCTIPLSHVAERLEYVCHYIFAAKSNEKTPSHIRVVLQMLLNDLEYST